MVFQKGNKEHLKAHRAGRRLPHTDETRKKISLAHTGMRKPWASVQMKKKRGELANNWKGGITPINKRIRSSVEYRIWRTAVFQRDNYTCVWCGARNGNGKSVKLNADHIKPFAYFPELRFAIDNGRTLCRPCHETTFKDIWKNYSSHK